VPNVNTYPGGLPFEQEVFIRVALPDTTTLTIPLTHDGLAAITEFKAQQTGTASATAISDSARTMPTTAVGAWLLALSGANAGLRRRITTRNSATQVTCEAFPAVVAVGDRFEIVRVQRKVHNIKMWVDADADCFFTMFNSTNSVQTAHILCPHIDDTILIEKSSRDGFDNVSVITDSDMSSYYVNIIGW